MYRSIPALLLAFGASFATLSAEKQKLEFCDLSGGQEIVHFSLLELKLLPELLSQEKLTLFKQWIDEMMPLAYEDFDYRVGIVWDDYLLDISSTPRLIEIDSVKKIVTINGVDVEQFPQSIFSYPEISTILLEEILPPYFQAISKHVSLPDTVYMQTFVLRSLLSEGLTEQTQHVRWHQDPSDYGTSVADYTLVLMLSDPFDSQKGWEGGEILLKNGLPARDAPAVCVTPKQNQAILFNNKNNSHLVTAIKNARSATTRDIVIINIYLKHPNS